MNTIIVDDKRLAVNAVQHIMQHIDPDGIHTGCTNVSAALEAAGKHTADVAFLDIEMPEMNGLELAKCLKDIHHSVNIVFVTGHPEYALEAHRLYVSGFLCKPVEEREVRMALEHLRHPVTRTPDRHLRIQCFGNFEVFVDEKPLHFQLHQTKELLAYLVDRRGASITMGEIMGILWEDRPDSRSQRSQLRNLIADLRSTLKHHGVENVIIKHRNDISINCSEVDCDYYRFLQGDIAAVNLYRGEYMSQYSWSEMHVSSIMEE